MACRWQFAAAAGLVASLGWPLLDVRFGSTASGHEAVPLVVGSHPEARIAEAPHGTMAATVRPLDEDGRPSLEAGGAWMAGKARGVGTHFPGEPLGRGSGLGIGSEFAGSLIARQMLIEAARQESELESLRRDREIQALTLAREKAERRMWTAGFGLAAVFTLALGVGYHRETRNAQALAAAKRQVEELARTDPLTGLANRRHAIERLEDEARRAERGQSVFSVVIIDIDNFKLINDSCGHACGDLMLVRVADVLRSTARLLDVPSRWGGDEFLIVLPGTDRDGAVTIAARVLTRLAEIEIPWDGTPPSVTATLGVAACRDGNVEHCLLAADGALYQGKESGRNTVIAA